MVFLSPFVLLEVTNPSDSPVGLAGMCQPDLRISASEQRVVSALQMGQNREPVSLSWASILAAHSSPLPIQDSREPAVSRVAHRVSPVCVRTPDRGW